MGDIKVDKGGRVPATIFHITCWPVHAIHGALTKTICSSRGSHIRVACTSVCDWDQNGIKRSTFFFGADQGIKTNSEWLISTDQRTFLDTTEVWLCFALWTPIRSSDQEPWNRVIKWSRTIFTNQDSWLWSQMLLQVTRMWLPLVPCTHQLQPLDKHYKMGPFEIPPLSACLIALT